MDPDARVRSAWTLAWTTSAVGLVLWLGTAPVFGVLGAALNVWRASADLSPDYRAMAEGSAQVALGGSAFLGFCGAALAVSVSWAGGYLARGRVLAEPGASRLMGPFAVTTAVGLVASLVCALYGLLVVGPDF